MRSITLTRVFLPVTEFLWQAFFLLFLKALREAGCGNEKRLMPDEEKGLAAYKKQKGILRREGAPKNGTWVILWKEKKTET